MNKRHKFQFRRKNFLDRVILNDLDFENRNEALYFFEKIMEIYKSIVPERHAENIEYM